MIRILLPAFLSLIMLRALHAAEVLVHDAAEFKKAVAAAKPGARIVMAEGTYGGGFRFANLRGTADQPIVIASQNPKKPAVFSNAKTGLQLSSPAYVELENLEFTALYSNGLNI